MPCCTEQLETPVLLEDDGTDPIPWPEASPVPEGWARRPDVVTMHRTALEDMARRAFRYPWGWGEGRGVVICGGGKFWPGIVVAVRMLRDTGSKLPVQIWHRGDVEPVNPADLEGLGPVEIIDATRIGSPRILRGWEIKLVALWHCPWESVLYLDADAYTVDDPAPLLDRADRTGFVYWSDMPGCAGNVKWAQVWPDAGRNIPPQIQGGQLAINRRLVWRELCLSHWLNQHSDYYYSHLFGDQDTWRVAFAVTGRRPDCLGPAAWQETAFVCRLGARPMVVHRCQGKLFRPEDIPAGKPGYSNPKWHLPKEERVFQTLAEVLGSSASVGVDRCASVFGSIYRSGIWGQGSGAGSNAAERQPYLDLVNSLIHIAGVRTVLDVGSGDGSVARGLQVELYTGVDVHLPMVERLSKEMPGKWFICLDAFADREKLPRADMLLVKDVLHHWPNRMVTEFLGWVRSCGRWKHVVLTQDVHQRFSGQDCHLGGYRALHPHQLPLSSFRPKLVTQYLHKAVLLL